MDKKISRPTSLIFTFDVANMSEDRVQKFRHDLVWHLRGQMETVMTPVDFDTEVWRETDLAAGDEPICGSEDETIGPLDSGARWVCQRVAGHDDPEEDGGHLRGWVRRTA